jgi:hypothetical protein
MFIRTNQYIDFIDDKNRSIQIFHKKKKNNIVKKFSFTNTNLNFNSDTLLSKMVPKKNTYLLNKRPIKYIITSNGRSLFYQDFSYHQCQFVTLDNNNFYLLDFAEIEKGTKILCYSSNILVGWEVCKVEDFGVLVYGDPDYKKKYKNLSKYILFTDSNSGLIVNHILVY